MRFGLLGPLEVSDDVGAVALGKPRQRAVLARLLLEVNHVVPVERIVSDLWGEAPPSRPVGAVHAYVSTLRRILEPDRVPRASATVLVSRSPGYLLKVDADAVDAALFEGLVTTSRTLPPDKAVEVLDQALALWRGPVLADFAFESWVIAPAARYDELRASAVESRFTALLDLGRHAELIADLWDAASNAPLRERLWELLMVALYRNGRQSEALGAYQRVRHHLAEELGIDPGPELQSLEQQVLDHASSLSVAEAAVTITPTVPADDEPTPLVIANQDDLVGRLAELTALRRLVESIRSGDGRAVAITGSAGVGKTRLVQAAFAPKENPDVTVVWGRCVDGAAAPALWPWLQVASALGPCGDGLADALHADTASSGIVDQAARGRAYEKAVAALLLACSQRPLIVVLDDMQWADAATHHIVQLLLTRLSRAPLLLVLTVRDGAGDDELQATSVALARSNGGARVELRGLSRDAVAQYLERTVDAAAPDDVVDLLIERTAGNAFFLTELVRLLGSDQAYADAGAVADAVPGSVRDVIHRRVSALPHDAERLLGVAAVTGREFDWRVVTKVAAVGVDEALEALDAATVSGLIEDAGTATRYRFAHDLVREALYGELSTPRRARLHAGIAEELFALHGRSSAHANEIAVQAWSGRTSLPASAVVHHLLTASDVAASTFAQEQAVLWARGAAEAVAELPESIERDLLERDATIRLGRLLAMTYLSASEETVSVLKRARDLQTRVGDTSAQARPVLIGLALQAILRGDIAIAEGFVGDLRAAGAGDDRGAGSGGETLCGMIELHRGRIAAAVDRFGAACDSVRSASRRDLVELFALDPRPGMLTMHGFALAMHGDPAAAQAARDEGLSLADENDFAGTSPAFLYAAWQATVDNDWASAARWAERATVCAARLPVAVVLWRADVVAGWARAKGGDPAAGLEQLTRGRRDAQRLPDRMHAVGAIALEAEILLLLDRPRDALDAINEGFTFHSASGERLWLPELHRLQGEALLRNGATADEVSVCYERARSVAVDQDALAFAKRAERSIAATLD